MKTFLILLITIYQGILSAILKNILGVNKFCIFSPTCSEYAKQMIRQYGVFGILLGVNPAPTTLRSGHWGILLCAFLSTLVLMNGALRCGVKRIGACR